MSDFEPEDRQQLVLTVVLKFLGIAAGIVLFILVVSLVVVKQLDLNADSSGQGPQQPVGPVTPLPSTALPDPASTLPPLPEDTVTEDPTQRPGQDGLLLSASPVLVGEMERINLTGQWPGHDAVSLLVQRKENGQWVDFGVQVQLEVGTFATYVLTGREGENKFRVYDPSTKTTSNEITVTVE